jgi:hypothetical protein
VTDSKATLTRSSTRVMRAQCRIYVLGEIAEPVALGIALTRGLFV